MEIIDTALAQKTFEDRYLTVKPKYVPFFFDDFLSDPRVNELEPEQQQQFLYLLVWMMRNEAQIAENHKTIARVLGLKSIKAAEKLINRLKTVGLLVASAAGHKLMALSSPRLLKEYRLAAHKTQVAVEKSRKAINTRWAGKAQNDDTPSNTPSIPEVYPENTPSNTDVDVEVLTPKSSADILQNLDEKPATDAPPVSPLPNQSASPKRKKKTASGAEPSEVPRRGVVGAGEVPHGSKGSRNMPRTKDVPPYTTGSTLQAGMRVYIPGNPRAKTAVVLAVDGSTTIVQPARTATQLHPDPITVDTSYLLPVDQVQSGRRRGIRA